MSSRRPAIVRAATVVVPMCALFSVVGCASESDEVSAPMTTASSTSSNESASSSADSSSPNSSASTSADPRILQPEDFELDGGKHAFRLAGSSDGCWFNSQADSALHCDLSLSDPPLVEDDNFDSPQPANMIGLASPDSGFEYRVSALGGGHNYDLKVLEPKQTLVIDGISCTAESETSLSCETKKESFEYADGAVTSDAPGLNRNDSAQTGSSSDTSCPGIHLVAGGPLTAEITGSTPMGCDEVESVSGQYADLLRNATAEDVAQYGNSTMREFDGWFCSAPNVGMSQTMGYTLKCTNDSEGKEFLSPT